MARPPKLQSVDAGLLILGRATAFLIVRKTQRFGLGLFAIFGPAFAAPATRNGEHRFPNPGDVVFPLLLTQRRTTMSTNTIRLVCRLLGGSGRASLAEVPTVKLPALLSPIGRPSVDAVIQRAAPPVAA
jgi:hypothetical protein